LLNTTLRFPPMTISIELGELPELDVQVAR
jgi:hypothetical protein